MPRGELRSSEIPSLANFKGDSNCPMNRDLIHQNFKELVGRVLTIIEASYSNQEQLRAVKTLVKKEFSEQMNRIDAYCRPNSIQGYDW